ncbi:hypothetical protein ACFFRR_007182 [Megaselia abdita]
MNSWVNVVFLCALCAFHATAFDKNIKISDLAGCRELLLDGYNNYKMQVPITSLTNNGVTADEGLQMKFYLIGFEFIINLNDHIGNLRNFVVVSGYNFRKFCTIGLSDGSFAVQPVNCQNHTSNFYYTEFTLSVNKVGTIQLFEGKNPTPIIKADNLNTSAISHLAFGRYFHEPEDVRLFFDCPSSFSTC